MVNRRICPDLKECALRLWNHGWDVEDICDALGVSKTSCYRWRRIFDELGTVNKPPSPLKGPTRIITQGLLTAIEDLFIEDSDFFLDEICISPSNIKSPSALQHCHAISDLLQQTRDLAGGDPKVYDSARNKIKYLQSRKHTCNY
jgi:hypothetical protein